MKITIKALLNKKSRLFFIFKTPANKLNLYFRYEKLKIHERNVQMINLVILSIAISLFLILGMTSAEQGKISPEYSERLEKATFAGGCFWCMEPPFDKLEGVVSTTSGYTGGNEKMPTYEQVASGRTGHVEAIEIVYDPEKVSYDKLLEVFWKNVNPTQANGQFADIGKQYRTVIFYHDDKQQKLAVASKENLDKSGKFGTSIVTEILPAGEFYPAEDYHQDYYLKNPIRYKYYRVGSGREQFLNNIWSDK
jgi:methionine-S-sulfoxide reductase